MNASSDSQRGTTVTVTVDSRPVEVDITPLPYTESATFRTKRIVRRGDRRLTLRPSRGVRLFGFFLLLSAVACLAVALALAFLPADPSGSSPAWVRPLFRLISSALAPYAWTGILVFGVCGLLALLGTRSICFDRGLSQVYYAPKVMAGRKRRPLSDILAVQIIPGEMHGSTVTELGAYQTYQLNLVLDDPKEPRLNLCDATDLAWLWETGQQIAEFLGRPFVDLVFGPDAKEEPPVQVRALPFGSITEGERDVAITHLGGNALAISQRAVSGPTTTLGGLIMLAMGVAGLLCLLSFRGWDRHPDLFDLWAGLVALAPGLAVFLVRWGANRANRLKLDRGQGMLCYGGWPRRSRPLSDVVAVQLVVRPMSDVAEPPPPKFEVSLPGVRHAVPDTEAEERLREATYCQLNLVMKDPPVRRVNLLHHRDGEWTRDAAQRIAEFLDVPLETVRQGPDDPANTV